MVVVVVVGNAAYIDGIDGMRERVSRRVFEFCKEFLPCLSVGGSESVNTLDQEGVSDFIVSRGADDNGGSSVLDFPGRDCT